jgi:hypothetical protein
LAIGFIESVSFKVVDFDRGDINSILEVDDALLNEVNPSTCFVVRRKFVAI